MRAAALLIATALIFATPRTAAAADEHEGDALGEVHFPVSCNEQAQACFNTAMSLLYSFYWERVGPAPACSSKNRRHTSGRSSTSVVPGGSEYLSCTETPRRAQRRQGILSNAVI